MLKTGYRVDDIVSLLLGDRINLLQEVAPAPLPGAQSRRGRPPKYKNPADASRVNISLARAAKAAKKAAKVEIAGGAA